MVHLSTKHVSFYCGFISDLFTDKPESLKGLVTLYFIASPFVTFQQTSTLDREWWNMYQNGTSTSHLWEYLGKPDRSDSLWFFRVTKHSEKANKTKKNRDLSFKKRKKSTSRWLEETVPHQIWDHMLGGGGGRRRRVTKKKEARVQVFHLRNFTFLRMKENASFYSKDHLQR